MGAAPQLPPDESEHSETVATTEQEPAVEQHQAEPQQNETPAQPAQQDHGNGRGQAERPRLTVIDPETDPSELDLSAEGVEADPPLDERVRIWISTVLAKGPAVWSQRPASLAERVSYSVEADWAKSESHAKRQVHLLGTLLGLLLGLAGAALSSAAEKPSRAWIALAALIILTGILG